MPWAEIGARTARLIERFAIAAPGPATRLNALSGGNQQRLVVARELEHRPALVVADNPTRGLDLQATAFVLSELRACAEQGSAVVMHSSDLDEILSLAARVLVVFNGQVSEAILDRETIGRAMLGAA
jgi:simple sugar transport system ATP-binding protein